MKKVGIMSMQKVKNYGSFLQAFALYNIIIKQDDCDVEFVDFTTQNGIIDPSRESYQQLKKHRIKYLLISMIGRISHLSFLQMIEKCNGFRNLQDFFHLYNKRFEKEFWPLLHISNHTNISPTVDLLVIGSDEVFNYSSNKEAGYSNELFGQNSSAKQIISFAGSFGCTTKDDLITNKTDEKIADYLSRFQALSVRDINSVDIIRSLSGISPAYHLDPVFHFDFSQYMQSMKIRKAFLAVYAYSGLQDSYKQEIKKYAEKHHLKILCFMGYQGSFGTFMDVDPFELLEYIRNAFCVVTTTFHGCVFSIKYNKSFCAIVQRKIDQGYGNEQKMEDLLSRCHLGDQATAGYSKIEEKLDANISYEFANQYISRSVNEGLDYLNQNISEI